MNKRVKSTAIFMAFVVTLSAVFSIATVSTVTAATTPTTTTISASNPNPSVGETVTFTINLKSGSTGLENPVKIWHTFNGVRYEDGTRNTVNGVYTYTQAFAGTGQRVYHADFAGDSQFAASSGTVTVNVKAATTTP